jgi:Kef-type K+ transport system membrane component KefB
MVPGTLMVVLGPIAAHRGLHIMGLRVQYLIVALMLGLVVGPSMIGSIAPGFTQVMFPNGFDSLSRMSYWAVVAMGYMAGMELRGDEHHGVAVNKKQIALLSIATIGAQVALAIALGLSFQLWFPAATTPWTPLGLMIMLPVIALPVLTAALIGMRMTQSKVGQVALTKSANSEIYLWPVFIGVTAVVGSEHGISFGWLIMLVALFVAAIAAARYALQGLEPRSHVLALVLNGLLLIAAVYYTDSIGMHNLLGAVGAGWAASRSARNIINRSEQLIQFGLAPFFLMGVGLTTRFELLDPNVWILTIILTLLSGALQTGLVGVLTKRKLGFSWKEGFATGFLCQMRGMVEIVISKELKLLGVINPLMFTSIILMAFIQTLIGPIAAQHLLKRD